MGKGVSRKEASLAIVIFTISTTLGYYLYLAYHKATSPVELTWWTFWPAILVYLFLDDIRGILYNRPKNDGGMYLKYAILYGCAWLAYWYCFWLGLRLCGNAEFALSIMSLMIIVTPLVTKLVVGARVDSKFIITSVLLILSAVLIRLNVSSSDLSNNNYWGNLLGELRKQALGVILLGLVVIFHGVQDYVIHTYNNNRTNTASKYWCRFRNRLVLAESEHVIFGGIVFSTVVSTLVFVAYIVGGWTGFWTEDFFSQNVSHYVTGIYFGLVPAIVLLMYIPTLCTRKSLDDKYIMGSLSLRPALFVLLAWIAAWCGFPDLREPINGSGFFGMLLSLIVFTYIVFPAFLHRHGFQQKLGV